MRRKEVKARFYQEFRMRDMIEKIEQRLRLGKVKGLPKEIKIDYGINLQLDQIDKELQQAKGQEFFSSINDFELITTIRIILSIINSSFIMYINI